MKLLVFAASNSKNSINKQLVTYASSVIVGANIELIDLNDYEMPLYSIDREEQDGIPALAQKFIDKIARADALLISYAEHNGSYTVAYKNIYDWASRIEKKVFQNKPMVLLATSPGPGGASNVLEMAKTSAPHFGGDVKGTLSIPSFYDNFDVKTDKITNADLQTKLATAMAALS